MTLLGGLLKNRRAGDAHLAWHLPNLQGPDELALTSRDFDEGGAMALEHCEKRVGGADLSPHLAWTAPPAGTAQLLLVVEDIDVPLAKPAVHCVALVDPAAGHLDPGALRARQPAPEYRRCAAPSGAGTAAPGPSRAMGRTVTSSSCSPSPLPSAPPLTARHRSGPGLAPSCPPSPGPSSAAAG